MVAAAVFGHHIKTSDDKQCRGGCDLTENIKVFINKLSRDLAPVCAAAGFGTFPECADFVVTNAKLSRAVEDMALDPDKLGAIETPVSFAIKAVTILADTLGSLTPSVESLLPTCEDEIKEYIKGIFVQGRSYNYPWRARLKKGQSYHSFQIDAKKLWGGDAILSVSCGRGKTNAGYFWADRSKKLIFTESTTGTTTQMYREHRDRFSKDKSSRSKVDHLLEKQKDKRMAELSSRMESLHVQTYDDSGEDAVIEQIEIGRMLRSFADFKAHVTYSTVDQLLGIRAFYRNSILWLLYLVDAQVVLDEFHSYDRRMWGWLLAFLDWFPGVRIFAMSATVSDKQQELLKKQRPTITVIKERGDKLPCHWPRYRLTLLKDKEEAKPYFKQGGLWIVNTVSAAQELARLPEFKGQETLLYHSKYRYVDRDTIFRRLMREFGKGHIRAIATQVAQISLNLSAQPLISEVCPIADFIQRLGRLVRYLKLGDPIGQAYFYMPETGYPYDPSGGLESFKVYLDWLLGLSGRELSQYDLDAEFKKLQDKLEPAGCVEKLPMYKTERISVRTGQTATLGLLRADVEAHNLRDDVRRELLQMYDIPFYMSPKDAQVIRAQSGMVHYRFVLDEPYFRYDSRIGLQKLGGNWE